MKKLLLIALLFCTAFASAQTFSTLYVFGDSLSDVGNKTPKNFSAYSEDSLEYKYSYGSRWSNGKVWNEYLAEMLDVAVPTNSENGGTNYAYGGGMSGAGTSDILGCVDINRQITGTEKGFAAKGTQFLPTDLVCLWGGANNLFFSLRTMTTKNEELYKTEAKETAQEMGTNINSLISLGAKTIVVMNLPNVGKTPSDLNDPEGASLDSLFSLTFNEELALQVAKIKAENANVKIIDIDVYAIFDDILANPSSYGFDDVTSESIAIYQANEDSYATPEEVMANVDTSNVLFWDDVHPSTYGHKAIADAVYASINSSIPEPSAYAAIFGALALAFAVYRKRK